MIQKLIAFVGGGDVENIRKMIRPSLNRMDKETSVLIDNYPTQIEVKEIIETLNRMKI